MAIINERSIESLTKVLELTCKPQYDNTSVLRNRFLNIDKYLQVESARHKEAVEGQAVNRAGDKSKHGDPEVALAKMQFETASAYMAGTFLNSTPLFPAVAPKQFEDVANQLTILSKRDEDRLKWVGNLALALDDAIKYNLCAVETGWKAIRATTIITNTDPNAQGAAELSPVIYEGNGIKRIDPYNLILDPTVPPFKNHEIGAYAGYIEVMNYIQLKEYFAELDKENVVKKHVRKIFQSNATMSMYYRPLIRKTGQQSGQDWSYFWNNSTVSNNTNPDGTYEVVTLYKKLIPSEYGIVMPRPKTPQIFKLVYVNQILLLVEPVFQGHEYLPIVVGQLYPGSIDDKGFVEYVMDLQDMASGMLHGMMDSFRRSVYDRGIYDPSRIRKQDIDNPNPVSKIPAQTGMHQQDVRTAYMPVPYDNRDIGNFSSGLSLAFTLTEQVTGQNQASQGRFIKGNKSVTEFDTIMQNSQARMQLGALRLSQFFFNPLLEILKVNYLVYSQAETIGNDLTGEQVEVNPQMLRDVAPSLQVGDGVMPSTKIMNTDLMFNAVQVMSQIPTLAAEYDLGAMIVSIFRQQGLTSIQDYKRSPEQQQQYLQLQAARAQAENPEAAQQQDQQPPTEG